MTHAQAAGQCQSDNASLAIVLNENDKVAMDYYRSSVGSDFWIGLKKKSGNEGSRCDQGGSVKYDLSRLTLEQYGSLHGSRLPGAWDFSKLLKIINSQLRAPYLTQEL